MQTLVFVGLGNPGEKFTHTRHNLGIAVLKSWVAANLPADQAHEWQSVDTVERIILTMPFGQDVTSKIHCLFPLTFMNKSGEAIAAYLHTHQLARESVVVIHDDIELSAGQVRFVRGGSAKGHNGIRSIYEQLGTQEIARLRLGIGRPVDAAVNEYVLTKFTSTEKPLVEEISQKAMNLLDRVSREGIEKVIIST